MKTLDEVIEAFDNWMPDCDSCVFYCDIYGENNCTIADALHYLKTFRDAKDALDTERKKTIEAYCQWKDAREKLEAQTSQMMWVDKHFQFEISDNPPLDWETLKQMEGKPVWFEWTGLPRWGIVDGIYSNAYGVENLVICIPHDYLHFDKRMQGQVWQAYRKERS